MDFIFHKFSLCCSIFKSTRLTRGTQRQFSKKYLFGRPFKIENFRNICCKISCLPASPRIFEHLKIVIVVVIVIVIVIVIKIVLVIVIVIVIDHF